MMMESLTFSIEDIFPMRKPAKKPERVRVLPSTMIEIEFADHRTFRLGDIVEFYVPGSAKLKGRIIEITVDGMVKVDPLPGEDIESMPAIERSGGRLRCRDYGIAGGFIIRQVRPGRSRLPAAAKDRLRFK